MVSPLLRVIETVYKRLPGSSICWPLIGEVTDRGATGAALRNWIKTFKPLTFEVRHGDGRYPSCFGQAQVVHVGQAHRMARHRRDSGDSPSCEARLTI